MKNNKGFTLVEVIAVTMLLAMLALILIPNVLNQRKKQEDQIKENEKKILYSDANRYIKENELLEASTTKCVSIDTLTKEGYASIDTENYTTKYIKVVTDENEVITSNSLIDTCSNGAVKKVNVTFDANKGTVSTTSIEVVSGKKYGDLPTPTRSGYTFKGWNGKNKFDKSQSYDSSLKNGSGVQSWGYQILLNDWVINNLKVSDYTVSYDAECISIDNYATKYSDNIGFYLYSSSPGMGGADYRMLNHKYLAVGEKQHFTATSTVPQKVFDTSYNYRLLLYTNRYLTSNNEEVLGNIKFTNIQLEEGDKATEYEPYYVTANTKVTQTSDHTLKAIWEAN